MTHLENWAGTKKVITCTFYFWNSGTQMQMSEDGTLRTLLYTVLQQAPELWTILFPSKQEALRHVSLRKKPRLPGASAGDTGGN
jgi:hypothetical protein